MEQSFQDEGEDLIARRLLEQTETEEFGDAKIAEKKSENALKRGGEDEPIPAAEISVGVPVDGSADTHDLIPTPDAAVSANFTKIEKSLASLGFFTPSSRRLKNQKSKTISFTREVNGKRVEVSAEIIPSAMFGLPVTADQDKWLALQKIITNTLQQEGKVTNPIRFRSADLLRLLGRSTKAGKNYNEINEWLDVMFTTSILSKGVVYIAGQKRFAKDRFSVFDRAVSVGKELADGTTADANYVWLSAWQLENINNNFLMPIDLETYQELKNRVAKALVLLLQVWLFASQKAGSFEKRYDELCEILALQHYTSLSQILRQLRPSLEELREYEYLSKWQIEKTADRKAYKIILFHGPKFHRDRRRRIEQKNQGDTSIIVAQSEPAEVELPQPGRIESSEAPVVAARSSESKPATAPSRSADPAPVDQPKDVEAIDLKSNLVDELSMRGIRPSFATKLLESMSVDRLEQVGNYIDYWDSAKKTKEVGQGFLVSLIKEGSALPATFETRDQRKVRLAGEDRRKNLARVQELLKIDYEKHCSQMVDRYITELLPAGEFENRVAAYKEETSNLSGFWNERPGLADQLARHAVRAEIAKEVEIPSYEDFCHRGAPRIASELKPNSAPVSFESREIATAKEERFQSTLSRPTSVVHPQDHTSSVSDENVSPRAV
jgi:hypothetical protein